MRYYHQQVVTAPNALFDDWVLSPKSLSKFHLNISAGHPTPDGCGFPQCPKSANTRNYSRDEASSSPGKLLY